ncbi:bifunctional 5,10-methylenetetrahydrofolate dehydrogenase/5,10-methenyltetrahydrofolate cyclohydrolase [bacterium]|nr:bifunctional 5,10-methylenetetrahydrofolate dehydrogenase/5,10-methenyltetrahydrofolate cyclohydrolase [bacterium]
MGRLLDGKLCARAVRERIRTQIATLLPQASRPPHAVFIQVGENPASTTYVSAKGAASQKVGILSTIERLPASISQVELLERIRAHNDDAGVHSILVQLPLPEHIDPRVVIEAIDPRKDVDCFHPENVGRMTVGLPGPRPATPQGIMLLLEHYGIELAGREVAILGRSNLVGKPMALLLLEANATVSIGHSRSRDLGELTRRADIIVSAVGRAGMLSAAMVKPGAVVVDVGINHVPLLDEQGEPVYDESNRPLSRIVGDVDFAAVEPLCEWITPVPGGVGPMTIASVLENTLTLYKALELQ